MADNRRTDSTPNDGLNTVPPSATPTSSRTSENRVRNSAADREAARLWRWCQLVAEDPVAVVDRVVGVDALDGEAGVRIKGRRLTRTQ